MVKLSWPKPSGIYKKQVIERWKEPDKSKTDMPCEEAVNCDEYSMSGLVTGLSLVGSIQGYTFKLVLYNGDSKVGEFYPDTIKTKGACTFWNLLFDFAIILVLYAILTKYITVNYVHLNELNVCKYR